LKEFRNSKSILEDAIKHDQAISKKNLEARRTKKVQSNYASNEEDELSDKSSMDTRSQATELLNNFLEEPFAASTRENTHFDDLPSVKVIEGYDQRRRDIVQNHETHKEHLVIVV
jgi:hypothetical protein